MKSSVCRAERERDLGVSFWVLLFFSMLKPCLHVMLHGLFAGTTLDRQCPCDEGHSLCMVIMLPDEESLKIRIYFSHLNLICIRFIFEIFSLHTSLLLIFKLSLCKIGLCSQFWFTDVYLLQ